MKKLLLALSGALVVAHAPPATADILLNEVNLNVPGPDLNFEFIELKSTTGGVESCAGLSIVIINNDAVDADTNLPENLGLIAEVFPLDDLSTGENGLLLLGNGYTGSPRGGPWAGSVDPATAVGDPSGMGDSDIGSNDGLTILLVRGLTAAKDQDVDVDNDTLPDWTDTTPPANRQFAAAPWTAIVDSIGSTDRGEDNFDRIVHPYFMATSSPSASIYAVWGSSPGLGRRDPDSFARHLTMNAPNSAAAWYGGKLAEGDSTTVTYLVGRTFGPSNMVGEATPGRPNLSTALTGTSFLINEVGLNPVGQNDRFQYIEIINKDGQARSLGGYWLILVDSFDGSQDPGGDNSPGVGRIIEKWDLSAMTTGSNGLLMIGDGFSSAYNSFQDLVSPQTSLGSPQSRDEKNPVDPTVPAATGFSEGDIDYKDGFTLLLVKDFRPATFNAQGGDFDSTPEDGSIDAGKALSMIGTVIDQVGFTQVGKTGIGKTYSTVDLRSVMAPTLVPSNLSRKKGNLAVAASAWYGGKYTNNTNGSNLGYDVLPAAGADQFFGGFRGTGTPGLPNLDAPVNPATPPIAAEVRLNEIMIDPTDIDPVFQDDNREFIEITSSTGGIAYLDGLWVLIVDLQGNASGTIVDSFPLDGLNTGPNGIAIGGDGYDNPAGYPYRASSVDGPLPPLSNFYDPPEGLGGNDFPNSGVAVLLIRGPKTGSILTQNLLSLTGDLDPENDGTLITPAQYCDQLVDSITTSTRNTGPEYAWIDATAFIPGHVARLTGNLTANNAAAWQYGTVAQGPAENPSVEYTGPFGGPFRASASPGRPNHSAPVANSDIGKVVLNEINLNPPGPDRNFEFVELLDVAGTSRSLNHYYLVMLDNVGPNTGSIRQVWSLDGMKTGTNGLLMIGNNYPAGGASNPFSADVEAGTAFGDPPGRDGLISSFNEGILGGDTDNLNFNLLLVRDFTGHIGLDLDQLGPGGADSDGDGQFDGLPAWTAIHDAIMVRDRPLEPLPAPIPAGWDGFSYGIADLGLQYLNETYYHPESFARFRGENTPNDAASWYGGDLNGGPTGSDGKSVVYETTITENPPFPAGFTGKVTPGQRNLSRLPDTGDGDTDGDGITDFLEAALGGNKDVADNGAILPVTSVVDAGGVQYAAISYRRVKGGTAAGSLYSTANHKYTVETSTDLATWVTDGSTVQQQGTATANPDNTETAVYRLVAPVTAPGGRAYMRLRVTKP